MGEQSLFDLGKPLQDFLVGGQGFPHFHKRTHDEEAHRGRLL